MLPDLTDQFIADSYAGIIHTSNVPVSQSNSTQVYDGKGNKTSMKIGAEGNGASFSGTVSVDELSIDGYSTLINYLYPIGSVYFSATNTNPSSRFKNTIWEQITQGQFIVSVGTGVDENSNTKTFNPLENKGSYSKTLDTSNLPSHSHYVSSDSVVVANSANALTSGNVLAVGGAVSLDQAYMLKGSTGNATIGKTSSIGGGAPIAITPPSFGLYVWKRTS